MDSVYCLMALSLCVEALQDYLLFCCQETKGGLVDKPGKYVRLARATYTLTQT